MNKSVLLCSAAVLALPSTAFAQSTGSEEFETIVVTGTRTQDVGGIAVPDTAKPKAVFEQEIISRQNPGQSILDTVNLAPGVSFQNNDAYGSSGGTLSIRGFDASRVSLTFDGIPLNDSGNYAIYSNQQLDPELIEQVNVNLGATDVDSPTASAVGGTVNYRTINPGTELGGRVMASIGEFKFFRTFGMIDIGTFTPWGTRAWVAASRAVNHNPFNNYGRVKKQQYNAKLYQPVGSNGDFVALSGHYNQNRNNFFGSVSLNNHANVPSGFPQTRDDREYDIPYPCSTDEPQEGVQDFTTSCGTQFDRRFNPSNTGNIRGSSRFTVSDGIVVTIDPYYQYVKANGGGTVTGREGVRIINGVEYTGFIGGQYYFGRDLNGDGDVLDTCTPVGAACSGSSFNPERFAGVTLLAPSQTRTHRYGVIAGVRWDINDQHSIRLAYTHDNANHRQTGQVGMLDRGGTPFDVFPVNDPLQDANGNVVQKRDRQSYAILNQIAGEWRGLFGPLTVNAGVRVPFFKRDLRNNCFTTSASGFIDCFGGDAELEAAYAEQFPDFEGPQRRVRKYSDVLPNIGAVYDFTTRISAFASYAKNISVPGTDSLYDAFFFPDDTPEAKPDPETTDTFDTGLRYRSSKIQAQVGAFYTFFKNRLASAYDPELDQTVFRNLGKVDKWGFDGSIAYAPIKQLTLYAFGSWIRSKIKDNLQIGGGDEINCNALEPGTIEGERNCAFTAGNREAGAPKYTFGGSVVGRLGDLQLGLTAKRTGPRFIFDSNRPVLTGDVDCVEGPNPACSSTGAISQLFPSKAPAYWLVHLDARYGLGSLGLRDTFVQLNVYNLFDKLYVGGFTAGLNQGFSSSGFFSGAPFAQIGAPRTVSVSLNIGF